MHWKMKSDQVCIAHRFERKSFYREIRAGNVMPVGTQAGGWRSQPERLSAKLVSGYQEDVHELSGV
jgi:hypothetical protein